MFGDNLNYIRHARGFTAKHMAETINVGIRAYRAYESNDRQPDFKKLCLLADKLEVSTDLLLGRIPLSEFFDER